MNSKQQELISVLSKELSESELLSFYYKNNIIFERIDLFRDFVLSLATIIHDTYLGDDMTPVELRSGHFDWCWKKNISNFNNEKIFFRERGSHYEYLFKYFMDLYYNKEDKESEFIVICEFWYNIMSYDRYKKQIELKILVELYKNFDKNLLVISKP